MSLIPANSIGSTMGINCPSFACIYFWWAFNPDSFVKSNPIPSTKVIFLLSNLLFLSGSSLPSSFIVLSIDTPVPIYLSLNIDAKFLSCCFAFSNANLSDSNSGVNCLNFVEAVKSFRCLIVIKSPDKIWFAICNCLILNCPVLRLPSKDSTDTPNSLAKSLTAGILLIPPLCANNVNWLSISAPCLNIDPWSPWSDSGVVCAPAAIALGVKILPLLLSTCAFSSIAIISLSRLVPLGASVAAHALAPHVSSPIINEDVADKAFASASFCPPATEGELKFVAKRLLDVGAVCVTWGVDGKFEADPPSLFLPLAIIPCNFSIATASCSTTDIFSLILLVYAIITFVADSKLFGKLEPTVSLSLPSVSSYSSIPSLPSLTWDSKSFSTPSNLSNAVLVPSTLLSWIANAAVNATVTASKGHAATINPFTAIVNPCVCLVAANVAKEYPFKANIPDFVAILCPMIDLVVSLNTNACNFIAATEANRAIFSWPNNIVTVCNDDIVTFAMFEANNI